MISTLQGEFTMLVSNFALICDFICVGRLCFDTVSEYVCRVGHKPTLEQFLQPCEHIWWPCDLVLSG